MAPTGGTTTRDAPRAPRPWALVAALGVGAATIALAAADTVARVPAAWATWNVAARAVARLLPADAVPAATGTLRGTVRDADGRPLAGATVVVPLPDGTALETRTGTDGRWVRSGIPVGRRPVWVGAPGHAGVVVDVPPGAGALGRVRAVAWPGVEVVPDAPGEAPLAGDGGAAESVGGDPHGVPGPAIDVTLGPPGSPAGVAPGGVVPGAEASWACARPVVASALRAEVAGARAGLPAGTAFRYRPDPDAPPPGDPGGARPPLLVVYPGPAATWECASIPLAAAGFEVVAYGPPYGFDVEGEVVRLRALLATLGERPAVLAGSYSAIHALRLVQDAAPGTVRAVVLMGPPVDLFDLRRRLEVEGWVPPFGLDRALVALGRPDREVARHARYSARLHVGAWHPPTLVVHSRSDEVVPVAQGEAYLRALAGAGVPAEGMFPEGGGHYLLSSGGEAEAILARVVAFLGSR